MQRLLPRWTTTSGSRRRPRPRVAGLILYGLIALTAAWCSRAPNRADAGLHQTYLTRPDAHERPMRLERVAPALDLSILDAHPELPKRFFTLRWEGYWYLPSTRYLDLYAGGDDRVVVSAGVGT